MSFPTMSLPYHRAQMTSRLPKSSSRPAPRRPASSPDAEHCTTRTRTATPRQLDSVSELRHHRQLPYWAGQVPFEPGAGPASRKGRRVHPGLQEVLLHFRTDFLEVPPVIISYVCRASRENRRTSRCRRRGWLAFQACISAAHDRPSLFSAQNAASSAR
jgi:hypothetical protein